MYEKLFAMPASREPMTGLAEWHFTDSAEVQLHEAPEHAGHSTLTLGVLPIEPEHARLTEARLGARPDRRDFGEVLHLPPARSRRQSGGPG